MWKQISEICGTAAAYKMSTLDRVLRMKGLPGLLCQWRTQYKNAYTEPGDKKKWYESVATCLYAFGFKPARCGMQTFMMFCSMSNRLYIFSESGSRYPILPSSVATEIKFNHQWRNKCRRMNEIWKQLCCVHPGLRRVTWNDVKSLPKYVTCRFSMAEDDFRSVDGSVLRHLIRNIELMLLPMLKSALWSNLWPPWLSRTVTPTTQI